MYFLRMSYAMLEHFLNILYLKIRTLFEFSQKYTSVKKWLTFCSLLWSIMKLQKRMSR